MTRHDATHRGSLGRKLLAYSFAAGAAAGAAAPYAQGRYLEYYNPANAGSWFDSCPEFRGGIYDMLLLKLDGTVLVDDSEIDAAGPVGNAIEFVHNGSFVWGDGKARDSINAVSHGSSGIVSGYWNAVPEGSKLGYGVTIDEGSQWWVSGQEVGLYGYGWYGCVGPWWGGGSGYLGFYIDNAATGRHYGWAHVTLGGGRNEVTLHSYAVRTIAGDAAGPGLLIPPLQDHDGNYVVDAADIDNVRSHLGEPEYDFNFDGVSDDGDIEHMIRRLVNIAGGRLGTAPGDVNLDGLVDATDLATMAAHFGQTGKGYADGNLNGDDIIDATDLAILHANYGFVAPTAPSGPPDVPEPLTLSLLALGATGLLASRKRQ